tara:strand:- start:1867 stop:3849 length:1983 start_codon:yes stop_codon:yes gene_type:complete
MKSNMTSFDVFAVGSELNELIDARLNKVYQVSSNELKIVLNLKDIGKINLVIECGKRIHTTQYPKPSPTSPSVFAMTLRKYLVNSILQDVRQISFDRIIELKFKKGEDFFLIIVELFGKGNILLTNEESRILAVMHPQRFKIRNLIGRETYIPPPPKLNPFELSSNELINIVNESKSNLVKSLASNLGLGGLYAEEICLRANVNKNSEKVDIIAANNLLKSIIDIKKEIGSESYIISKIHPFDVVPHPITKYSNYKKTSFTSFNNALDEFYTKYEVDRIDNIKEERFKEKLSVFETRLKDQEDALNRFKSNVIKYKELGNLIFSDFGRLSNILESITEAKRFFNWDDIIRKINTGKGKNIEADLIKEILPNEGSIIVTINDNDIRLDVTKSASQNADFYYNKSKKFKSKINGANIAISKTKDKLKSILDEGSKSIHIQDNKPKKLIVKEKKWYEKFRWFTSSDGFLILGGRDSTSNEILVKKHMSKNDIFVHADIHGAPAVIIKTEGKPVPQSTISEAYDFAASFSKAWKHNLVAIDTYWVNPTQVSKTTEHGEYISKGAFVIRGKRNIGKGKVELGIGIFFKDDIISVFSAPLTSIQTQNKYVVKLVPGRLKSKETAEKVKDFLIEISNDTDQIKIKEIPLTDIQIFLPSGGCEVLKRS